MDAALALALLAAAGGPVAPRRALLDHCGDAASALRTQAAWRASGLTPAQAAFLSAPPAPLRARLEAWLAQPGHAVLDAGHPGWPPALGHAPHPPLALFVAGDASLAWRPAIAVVGSRSPTPTGRQLAAEFALAFARAGFVVGSGMAAGIDAAAHAAVLEAGGPTFGVLGTGCDVAYPRGNAGLHRALAERGALLSEHPPGTGPRRAHFPSRNRLLAALCVGTVVIEAAERSGALITARLAAEAGREVFALPGSVRNPKARGCHRLIRDGAALVEGPDEVIAALAGPALREGRQIELALCTPSPAAADPVLDALGFDPAGMDVLAERLELPPAELAGRLLALELEGRVVQRHGLYERVA